MVAARTLDFGLALGGGGAKGLSHIPFLAALDELNVRPAIIAGTSIGAILAAYYAAGLSAAGLRRASTVTDGLITSGAASRTSRLKG